jgi:amino acid transporter
MNVTQISKESNEHMDDKATIIEDVSARPPHSTETVHVLQRQLNNRQIQLIAIGGSIGTAIFVSIGSPLATAGPGNLLLGYTTYCIILALASNGIAEMTTYMPVSGGFITLAGKWVDEALGFMAGWNFFLYEALIVPFEITALHLVLSYWSEHIPVLAVCLVTIFLYGSVTANLLFE